MKEQSNGVPAALPTLLRAVEAEQASGCAAAEAARAEAHRRWAAVAKPLGSLGLLEAAVEDAAALGQSAEVRFDTRAVLVLCADNGVVRQGVSQVDSTVTAVAARSIAAGRSSVGQMAALAHCDVITVDMGMQKPVSGAGLLERRIGAAPRRALWCAMGFHSTLRRSAATARGMYVIMNSGKVNTYPSFCARVARMRFHSHSTVIRPSAEKPQ